MSIFQTFVPQYISESLSCLAVSIIGMCSGKGDGKQKKQHSYSNSIKHG